MMKEEFERLAGYQVSYQDYTEIIEPMYLATQMDKLAFVKCLNPKRFKMRTQQDIFKDMKKTARHLYDNCYHFCDAEAEDRMRELRDELEKLTGASVYFEDGEHCGCYYPQYVLWYGKYGACRERLV